MSNLPPPGSILSASDLASVVKKLQRNGKAVVWTNGCFDILHAGHLSVLEQAKAAGDALIVGLNSDASVRKLKGPGRPANHQRDRARMLAALRPVDYVVIFRGETPLPIIKRLKPDIYVKGGDYNLDTIQQDERRCVESYGGSIILVPLVKGASTTSALKRIALRKGKKK